MEGITGLPGVEGDMGIIGSEGDAGIPGEQGVTGKFYWSIDQQCFCIMI